MFNDRVVCSPVGLIACMLAVAVTVTGVKTVRQTSNIPDSLLTLY